MPSGGPRTPSNPAVASGPGRLSTKVCVTCKIEKELSEFKNRKLSKDGKRNDCRACSRRVETLRRKNPSVASHILEVQRKRRKINYDPLENRAKELKKKYGISLVDYNVMFLNQSGVCRICKKQSEDVLAVDHNHQTGKVRGLLCSACNKGLGHFCDSIELLSSAVEYLKSYELVEQNG